MKLIYDIMSNEPTVRKVVSNSSEFIYYHIHDYVFTYNIRMRRFITIDLEHIDFKFATVEDIDFFMKIYSIMSEEDMYVFKLNKKNYYLTILHPFFIKGVKYDRVIYNNSGTFSLVVSNGKYEIRYATCFHPENKFSYNKIEFYKDGNYNCTLPIYEQLIIRKKLNEYGLL